MASTAPHPVAVEGARPPAGRGGVELGHPRWRGWRSAGVREEGGGPSSCRSTTARWPPPRLAPSPWRELGRPRAAAAWRGWRSAGVREEACRGGPSRAAGVEGAGQRGMREPMPMNTEGKSSESSEGVRLKANAELGIGGDS